MRKPKRIAASLIDCDTAADHFSELSLPAGPTPFIVTGKVKLMNIADSRKYVPLARLMISNTNNQPGPADEGWAGFELMVAPTAEGKAPTFSLLNFSTRKAGGKNEPQTIGAPAAAEVPFSLSYDGHHVEVTVDGNKKQFDFTAPRPVVRIVCSTGEFLYTNVTIQSRN